MTFMSHLTNYKLTLAYLLQIPDFSKFMFELNYEKFKLYLQNTLNMLKMTRVYFGVLQIGSGRRRGATLQANKNNYNGRG